MSQNRWKIMTGTVASQNNDLVIPSSVNKKRALLIKKGLRLYTTQLAQRYGGNILSD